MDETTSSADKPDVVIPFFGARKMARALHAEVHQLRARLAEAEAQRDQTQRKLDAAGQKLKELGAIPLLKIEAMIAEGRRKAAEQEALLKARHAEADAQFKARQADADAQNAQAQKQLADLKQSIVATEDLALLQEAGVYKYRHPLTDVVAYQSALANLEDQIKAMTRKDGGAVLATTNWLVNDSAAEGRAMVRDFSKLMLRAFNAEADTLVRGLKPYKLQGALERLRKVSDTIERLGKTMHIRISEPFRQLRERELELTADFLQKQAEQKEIERLERDRLREERKAQQEIERERARLDKERQHYVNALQALIAKGDDAGAARLRDQLGDVDKAIADVDYRAANIRAGYVYVISNVGSFGERMVKVGMTRRLDPMDRVRELGDASVPFNFDVHALFFSKDAVGIESAMHDRLAGVRVNLVNRRREFFRATPAEAKAHLSELAGELLQFDEMPEALEYRQGLQFVDQPSAAS